jgi:hypothetical protein
MNIKEWAEINNFTPEQFKKEMVQFMAVIGAMDLDDQDNKESSNGVAYITNDSRFKYTVYVMRNEIEVE